MPLFLQFSRRRLQPPAELIAEAGRLGVRAVAITDHDGMYGAVQFAEAAKGTGIKTIFGAELSLGLPGPQNGEPDPHGRHLLVLARDAEGYRRLCAQISKAQLAGGEKGRPVYDLDDLSAAHDGHWAILTGCRKGAVRAGGSPAAELAELVDRFGEANVVVELIDHDQPLDDARDDALYALAGGAGVGVVASNDVHFAAPKDADLAEALAAIRARRSLDDMTSWLPAAGTAYLRWGTEMAARLARFPGMLEATTELGMASPSRSGR